MIQCPSCEQPCEPRLTCPECQAPLAANIDLFAALDLPRKLQLDSSQLESIYHDLGRRIHPDRFASATPKVRSASLRATALLTRAYRTLRDPVSRAGYWLQLHGQKPTDQSKGVPADVAAMVFETQEELADLRQARNENSANASDLQTSVNEKRAEVVAMLESLGSDLERSFVALDENQDSLRDDAVAQLQGQLAKLAYLKTLLRDIEKTLDTKAAA